MRPATVEDTLFLARGGRVSPILGVDDAAPGGGEIEFFYSPAGLNERGDLAILAQRSPAGSPFGRNAALYRYTRRNQTLAPVVLPGVTPVPGGGTFAGAYYQPSLKATWPSRG